MIQAALPEYLNQIVIMAGVMGLGKGKKKGGKLGAMEKKEMPVETDPARLVNYVCGSNIHTTGEDVQVNSGPSCLP